LQKRTLGGWAWNTPETSGLSFDWSAGSAAWMALASRRRSTGESTSIATNAGSPGVVHLSVVRRDRP
jgi:hypothetical protein